MEAILATIAGGVIAPVIKKILEDKIGGVGGELAGKVIDVIAEKAGVPVDKLDEAPNLPEAIAAAEPEAVEILAQHVESQRLMNENLKAELDQGGPIWTWAWRPGWMWLLAFVWLYALVLRPLVNAGLGASIEAVDLGILMTLTGVFTGLYMGGHTALKGIEKWRSR